MKTMTVILPTVEKVKDFVNTVTHFEGEFDLVSGRHVIDAKSIMGVFSLNLSQPIELRVNAVEEDEALAALKPFEA